MRYSFYIFFAFLFLTPFIVSASYKDNLTETEASTKEFLLPAFFYINNDKLIIASDINKLGSKALKAKKSNEKIKVESESTGTSVSFKSIIPIIIAFILLLSNLWLTWKNHELIKKRKWYDYWSGKLDAVQINIYKLCNDILSSKSGVEAYKIKLSFLEIESQLFSTISKDKRILNCLEDIQIHLLDSNPYQKKEKIYNSLSDLSKYINGVIKDDR